MVKCVLFGGAHTVSQGEDSCKDVHEIVLGTFLIRSQLELLRGKSGLQGCIKLGLERSLNSHNWRNFQRYNSLASEFPSGDYVSVLCASLDMLNPKVQPSDVLLTLQDIKDPRCVPSVRRILFWKPDWDEYHDLAFKAFDVLLNIDIEESWKVIQEATEDGRPRVRELASRFLEKRKI
jgi:hypothetical protein